MNCFKPKDPQRRRSKELDEKIKKWMKEHKRVIKLLLLGAGESGKTTIIKQMKIIHEKGFTLEDREKKAHEIRRNLLEAIKELTGNMMYLKPPISLHDVNNEESMDFVRNLDMLGEYHFPPEFYKHVKKLWLDEGVQECFYRSNEFPLIDSAKYFLDKIDEIAEDDYLPSDQDILCCRKRTSEIQKIEFSVKIPKKHGGGIQEFWMFDVGGQRGERRKWIQVFDGIEAVLFLTACSGFDMTIRENNETNRLQESLSLFKEVWQSKYLRNSGFILFLNKQDLLKEKLQRGCRLLEYYPEFETYFITGNDAEGDPDDLYIRARCFIRDKFLAITRETNRSITATSVEMYAVAPEHKRRECFWHYTTATDTDNVQKVFNDVHTMIILWNLDKITPS